jgi:hypothetical protein
MEKKLKKLKKVITIDDLALMVQKGFTSMKEYMDSRFKKLEKGQAVLEKGQAVLEKGQEDIKIDLNQRVHIFDHKSLEFRVDRLEEKVGIVRKK